MRLTSSPRLALGLAAALAAGVTTACNTDAVGPRDTAAGQKLTSLPPRRLNSTSTTVGDTTYASFTLNGNGGTWVLVAGEHKLVFGNGLASVCDPATSSYGPGTWDAPCAPATQPITVTAKIWTNALGRSQIDFSPALRFVPTDDPKAQVTLQMYDKNAAASALDVHVNYCALSPLSCADEALADPSLAATRGTNGFINRRLKHFSGYVIALGFSDDGLGINIGL